MPFWQAEGTARARLPDPSRHLGWTASEGGSQVGNRDLATGGQRALGAGETEPVAAGTEFYIPGLTEEPWQRLAHTYT